MWIDSIFLLLLVFVSSIPYAGKLGFYSDDWDTKAVLARSVSQGMPAMIHQLLIADPDMRVRPGQYIYLVSAFKLWGQNPLPYHLFITIAVGAATALLYAALCALGMGRGLSLSVAAVWSMLPQNSTDRLWISSQQVSLCMALAFAGVIALIQWHKHIEKPGNWKWLVAAMAAMALSLLCYEISLGIVIAALLRSAWKRQQTARAHGDSSWKSVGGLALGTLVLAAVGIAKAHMETRLVYHHQFSRLLGHMGIMTRHVLAQAVDFNLWAYVGQMPHDLRALAADRALSGEAVLVAVLVTGAVGGYAGTLMRVEDLPGTRAMALMAAAGFVLFFLGTLLLANQPSSDFATTGTDNRFSMAAAVGAACVLVALLGTASALVPNCAVRAKIFAGLVGLACGVNCLVLSGISHYWTVAEEKQLAVLASVHEHLPALEHGSVLLLDGFCRYEGPASVFETDWDSTAALTLLTGDSTLHGDVLSTDLAGEPDAVRATVPDEEERTYLYGKNLFVYNLQSQKLVELKDPATAEAYFRPENRAEMARCPAGSEGRGSPIY